MSFLSGLFGRAARPATAPAPTPAAGAARDAYERGVAALASGDAAAGIDHLEAALALRQPEDDFLADALARLARALHDAGRHEDALRRAEPHASTEPSPAASLQVAQELHCCGRAQDAMQVVSQVLSADPRNLDATRGRAMILLQLGRTPEALDAWNDVIAVGGETPMSLTQRAVALQRLGRPDEALRDTDAALRLDPQDRGALVNRVALLTELLRLDDAKKAAQDALRAWPELPELHLNLSIVHMLLGELEPGWVEREWRWKIPSRSTQARWAGPRWRGEDLADRTLLLFAEQGFGDTIQFARYVPMLAARAKAVLLAVPRELESLLSDLAPNSRVLHEGDAMPAYDFQCPFLSVPGVVGTPTADAIPAPQRYLRAPADAVEAWKLRLGDAGGRRTVGLVWSGNPEHTNDRNRSLPLQMLRELAETGCRFVSLQPQVRAGDEAAYRAWPGLLRFG
jgi:tetratricopeptide (TPR) repeat protein